MCSRNTYPRGALCESEGVSNSGSGGRIAVNVCDLGISCNDTPG